MDENRQAQAAAGRFVRAGSEISLEILGLGRINDTYLVRCTDGPFVLQRINRHVFPRPELVVKNFETVTAHLARRALGDVPQWRDIRLIPTVSGESCYRDESGEFWRAQTYLGGTTTFSLIDDPEQARQVGLALGTFHRLLAGLSPDALHDTLPGFHVLESYLATFDRIAGSRPIRQTAEIGYCFEVIANYRSRMGSLKRAEEQGLLVPHVIHGDPKADNVLFDEDSGRAVCLIDLDTVRPGLLQYDIGDCLRSCCNPAGEDGDDWRAVSFDALLAREILAGYYAGTGELITPLDRYFVHDAVCLLSFELGLRYFTDFLDGNRYFKITSPDDNLVRALRQFALLADLVKRGDVLTQRS